MNYKIENDFIKYIRKELEKMERFEILEVNGKNKEANQKEIERINKILLPELFDKIYKLLED